MEDRNAHRVREHEDFPVVLLHITCGEAGYGIMTQTPKKIPGSSDESMKITVIEGWPLYCYRWGTPY